MTEPQSLPTPKKRAGTNLRTSELGSSVGLTSPFFPYRSRKPLPISKSHKKRTSISPEKKYRSRYVTKKTLPKRDPIKGRSRY